MALDQTPNKHPDRALCLQNLAVAIRHRYHRFGDLNDLELSLQHFQEAVDLTVNENSKVLRAMYLQTLAVALRDRYERFGDIKDLEAMIKIRKEALDLIPKGHSDRALHLRNLAIVLRDRYQRFGDLPSLNEALEKFQEAVDLVKDKLSSRAEYLQSLAGCFDDRYQRLGDLKDLETALHNFQLAVELTPAGHPNQARCLHSIAASFLDRYNRLGDLEDLEAAVKNFQEALELTPEGHPDRVGYLQGLSACLHNRYLRLGNLGDLDIMLQTAKEAVELTPEGHPARAEHIESLASACAHRYKRLGDLNDLETALQRGQAALDLTPEDHPFRPQYLQALALSYRDRYRRSGDLKDLEMTLQKRQEAVQLAPEGHPNTASHLEELAISFHDQYQRLGDPKDLEIASEKFQQALNLLPENHSARARHIQTVAISIRDRYRRFGDPKDLEVSTEKFKEAVDLTPIGDPERSARLQSLAISHIDQYYRFRKPEDLEAVHTLYDASFKTTISDPEFSWKEALYWASFSEKFHPSDCSTAYSAAFRLLPEILWIGHSIPLRHNAIRRLDIAQVTSTAARTLVNLSDLTSAVEIMEQGLATTFQQMLQLPTGIDKLQPDQADTFRMLSAKIYSGEFSDSLDLVNQRNELLQNIRRQPGLEYFLLPKPYDVLRTASKGGPIILLNSHQDQCDAILIPNPASKPLHIAFPNVTIDLLRSQRDMLKNILGNSVRTREQSESTRLFARRERLINKTNEELFTEMCDIYGGRLWWLPTGAFTGLPLHASPPDNRFIHSYTTTLGSLIDAHAKKSASAIHKLGVVGVTHTGWGRLNYLRGVHQEVENILSIFNTPDVHCLEGQEATVDAVKQELQNCAFIHLACHGKQDLAEPTKSHLQLYGGILELETILQMPLSNAEFVFLAACQTAMGDSELVNESFHLGGGFIAAGFRGAIGTLWSIYDTDGPLVAQVVYSHLFRDGQQSQATDAAEALQLAVNELKARKVPYERWIPFVHMGI
ncbi:CHAT domain-containing protein [Mycena vulgaris]|nr:CHAT domain-containing protein [Mycena vulgaris]